jgi:hypothetical protein
MEDPAILEVKEEKKLQNWASKNQKTDSLYGQTLEDESSDSGDDQQTQLQHKYVFWLLIKGSLLRRDHVPGYVPDEQTYMEENRAMAKFGTVIL